MNVFEKVSQKELEEIAGMPVATQNYRRCRHPETLPPAYKFGRRIYYNKSDVLDWIDSCRIGRVDHV